jgi:hypothetical protein
MQGWQQGCVCKFGMVAISILFLVFDFINNPAVNEPGMMISTILDLLKRKVVLFGGLLRIFLIFF